MITNNLLKSIKLPYNTVKGTVEQRQQKAAQFTHKVMNQLSGSIDGKEMSISKFGRSLKKILPKNLNVYVKKNKDTDSDAQLSRVYSETNQIIAQVLEINTNEHNKLDVLSIPIITHEIRHLADTLYHPKILSRAQMLIKKEIFTDKFFDFYQNDVYIMESGDNKSLKKYIIQDIKYHTKKTLRGLPVEDKVNLLQYMRYSLISERNAYKAESKIAKKMYKKNKPFYKDSICDPTNDYMFDDKIKLFKNMSFELLKKERNMHKANLKKISNKSAES